MKIDSKIWFTWETQRRNKELASAFGAKLKVFDHSNKSTLNRYFKSAWQTLESLAAKPDVVFAQCPSLVLCLELALLKPVYNYRLIIDCHNIVVDYLYSKGPIIKWLTKVIIRSADFLIVSNSGLLDQFPVREEKILVLPDRLPTISLNKEKPKILAKNKINITFICSFAADEPVLELLEAAKRLTSKCKFFITGKKKSAFGYLNYQSEDIVFTDYLSEQKYEALIAHSDLNIDLTTKNDLLVCGAYETLAVNVPGLLSDTKIQRQTFPQGFAFTSCGRDDLFESIKSMIDNLETFRKGILECKAKYLDHWNVAFEKCLERIKSQ